MSAPAPAPRGATRPLSTVSIRVRVIAAVMAVLAVVLLSSSVAVNAVFVSQSQRNLDTLLSGRAQLARQLARAGVRPQQIVNRVGVDGVLASLELRDGTVLGTAVPGGSGVTTVTTTLPGTGRVNGARLTLAVNTSLVSGAQDALRRTLLVSGLAALVLSGLLVALAVRLALRPLDAMAALAQQISAGARGSRLSPSRTDTEIGRTAAAFDAMLDELEGAEVRARRAEEQTRAFLADAAHELRTPLTGVQAAAETLLQHRDAMSVEEQERLEALLVGEARRAGRLVGDLLAVARLEAGAPTTRTAVDVGALVESEVDRASLLRPGTTLTSATGDAGRVVVSGDEDALRGVLRNLLDNASRAAGEGGHVHVGLRVQPGLAVVDVVDDGPGVAAEDRERIFDRLVRLDAARSADAGGSGLGLAIARGTARAHGGDLVCLPAPAAAHGADFRLTLPLAPGPRGEDGRGPGTLAG
ncbi:sensor histidine kinase [Microlunatus flavus]|uniref:histidine kinase n=1 Tax=Microlunatus flavus TaxID=1036181 RepID=A0A1H9LCF2_9ACTN|nr:HAMP domain-containing sensor histidine kinase [Microlunatus flavus]SER08835.1 Signal transduction histidine kinase [Microlunatus flavus]